jgi:hypothetical protein
VCGSADFVQPIKTGIAVMITIFCDFRQFSAKKIGVFLKNQCYDQNFAYFSFVLSQKGHFFAELFGENIFKITTSVPDARLGLLIIT